MSGHSKWHTIKHKKGALDAKRGKIFTKMIKEITVATRTGASGDVDSNARLRKAVTDAKAQNMPNDTIDRAIKRGMGEGEGANYDEVTYEGYGPNGVAVMVEAMTDNRNRTGSEVRHLLAKHGGNLGEPGSVAYLFDKQGVIVVSAERYGEEDLLVAVDAGAQDIARDDDVFEVLCEPADLTAVRAALEAAEVEIEAAEVTQRPKLTVPVADEEAVRLLRLVDALEESEDVDAVHANFDVSADVLERVAG